MPHMRKGHEVIAFLGNLASFDTLVSVRSEIKATVALNRENCRTCNIKTRCPLTVRSSS